MTTRPICPIIKIYEALGAVADGRVIIEGNEIKVYSSSGNKYYNVWFEKENNSIMTNDNATYWKGYIGYPAIAYLLQIGQIPYNTSLSSYLKDIPRKDINVKHGNNYEKTLDDVQEIVAQRGGSWDALNQECLDILDEVAKNEYQLLGEKKQPPEGY